MYYYECYNSALDAAAAIGRDFKVSHWIRFGGRIYWMRHAYSTAIQNLLIIVKCICPLSILQHCGFNLYLETVASPLVKDEDLPSNDVDLYAQSNVYYIEIQVHKIHNNV